MWIKNFEEWMPVLYFFICKFVFLWYFFLITHISLYFLLFYEIWDFPKQMMWNPPGIYVFLDLTHETVVQPATDFSILRKCSIILFMSSDPTFLFHLFA